MKLFNRVFGGIRLGFAQIRGKLRGGSRGRLLICLLGVGLAIAVLVVVLGLSFGLAGGELIESEDVDLWLLPDDAGLQDGPLPAEGSRIDSAHDLAATIEGDDRVDFASPVLIEFIEVENTISGERAWVVGLGIKPLPDEGAIAGLETSALRTESNDEGSIDLVLSAATGQQLLAVSGDEVRISGSDRTAVVAAISEEDVHSPAGELPVVLMDIDDLQQTTGAAEDDLADQILISTDSAAVQSELRDHYPEYEISTRADLFGSEVSPTDLPVAMAAGAGLVAIGIAAAFVATTMGLELAATRRSMAVLDALGVGTTTKSIAIMAETLIISVLGGLLGVVLGWIGINAINTGLAAFIGLPTVAIFSSTIALMGIAAAILVGMISVWYPWWIAWRTNTLEELTR